MKSLPLRPEGDPAGFSSGTQLYLGRRLRALREQRRLTLDQVARATGLSKSFISRIERDLVSPSVSSLVTICQVLGISAGELLDSPQTYLVRYESAPEIDLGGAGIAERLLSPFDQRGLQLIHASIAPGGEGEEELYTMDCAMEAVHVISGEFVLVTSDEQYQLKKGDTVTFPGKEAHTWRNPRSDVPAEVLWVLTRYPVH
ncbi:helix-turn-helix domain-containing protein [Corynebacterium poyangense]|uniref:Helix-turn-helix domain-containing protein n=1 Tax=Corynebacterium poyangense TaxID=2684405 RepID=A0A7H0SRG2_9CORY|nr:XRE family transcriptional regulator [Corynebacterium poyangense]QNQ91137.1 helix-turn-helix domain-containing protein [Corynebacterium poyangense]